MSWKKIKIDPADRAFAQWIKYRDGWKCKRCQKQYPVGYRYLQNSHFKGRRKENTRFEPLNTDALCAYCHQYFTSQPDEHTNWQVQMKGQTVVDMLTLAGNTYKKKDRKLELLYWQQRLKEDFGVVL
jgi:hypothetical protein